LLGEFDEEICSKVVKEYLAQLQQNKQPDSSYFITHTDPEIAKLAVDAVATLQEHDFSEGWERLNVFLNTQDLPERNHVADAQSGILRFKLRKIERLIRKNQLEIKAAQEAKDMTNMMISLKINQKLQTMKMNLAKVLNTVVLR
jgi:DNA primase